MIKFAATNSKGMPVIGLGLSRANCERLLAGQPIRINSDEIVSTLDFQILLFAGETEQAIADDFKKHGLIGPDTKISGIHPDDPHRDLSPTQYQQVVDAAMAGSEVLQQRVDSLGLSDSDRKLFLTFRRECDSLWASVIDRSSGSTKFVQAIRAYMVHVAEDFKRLIGIAG